MHRLTDIRVPVLAATLLAGLALAACGKDDVADGAGRGGDRGDTTTQAATPPPATSPAPDGPASTTGTTAAGCRVVEAPEPKEDGDLEEPSLELDDDRTFTAMLETSCGDIEIRLDVDDSPDTAASFVSLARDDFYDDLTFHRISRPGGMPFVIQGGDPLGTGNGGPGYSVTEAPPQDTQYRRGTVAMAKTEIEEPGTSGSQFFIVTAEDSGLPADYAVLGRVVDGLDVVDKIGDAATDPTTEMPNEPVVIEDVTIRDSGR